MTMTDIDRLIAQVDSVAAGLREITFDLHSLVTRIEEQQRDDERRS